MTKINAIRPQERSVVGKRGASKLEKIVRVGADGEAEGVGGVGSGV